MRDTFCPETRQPCFHGILVLSPAHVSCWCRYLLLMRGSVSAPCKSHAFEETRFSRCHLVGWNKLVLFPLVGVSWNKCLEWAAASGPIKTEGPVHHTLTPNVAFFSRIFHTSPSQWCHPEWALAKETYFQPWGSHYPQFQVAILFGGSRRRVEWLSNHALSVSLPWSSVLLNRCLVVSLNHVDCLDRRMLAHFCTLEPDSGAF